MKNHERALYFRAAQNLLNIEHRLRRQIEFDRARGIANSERREKSEMMIHRMRIADRGIDKMVVEKWPPFRSRFRSLVSDFVLRPREKCEQCRTIGPRQIEAVTIMTADEQEPVRRSP